MFRALVVIVFGLIACAGRDQPPRDRPSASPVDSAVAIAVPDAKPALVAPGLRLPDDVRPLGYALRLELDPDSARFRGEVEIRVRIDQPTEHVWLHVVGLELEVASWRRSIEPNGTTTPLVALPLAGDEMRAFALGETVAPGEIALRFVYSGAVGRTDEGLFRQRDREHWYLYSQSEAIFARRILPCFDEPRWKVPWKVTLVTPAKLIALANAAQVAEQLLSDGRREVSFAATPPMPSYLLAVAVGPFAIVDAGTVGRARVPLRVVVAAPDAKRAGIAAAYSAKLIDRLEQYFDSPLPWPKLDLVAVPSFFGAMENPGLITFASGFLVGETTDRALANRFVRTAAHEYAHLWFGDWVTFAAWDDLWLAEAFASWMADKLAIEIHAFADVPYALASARQRALGADDAPDARPLRRPLAKSTDAEEDFDAIAYEKGAAVLAMFERFVGEPAFRAAIRRYIDDHRGGNATSADLIAAFERETDAATSLALASFLDRAGAPVVELAVRCDHDPPRLEASAHGSIVPTCVRYPGARGDARTCALVGDRTEITLPEAAGCPVWVVGNEGGSGYYHVRWREPAPDPAIDARRVAGRVAPIARLGPAEQIARGDDLAAGLARGDVTVAQALDALQAFAASRDPYARLGALAIARAIDPVVDDAARVQWSAWLGARFADVLVLEVARSPTPPQRALRDGLYELGATPPAAATARARKELARTSDLTSRRAARLISFVGPGSDRAVFDRIVAALPSASTSARDMLIEAIAELGPDHAGRLIDLALATKPVASSAILGLLARGTTRTAGWRAVQLHAAELIAKLDPADAIELVVLIGDACDPRTRTELTTTLEPLVRDLVGGRRTLDRALARIDRCILRRAQIGDVATRL